MPEFFLQHNPNSGVYPLVRFFCIMGGAMYSTKNRRMGDMMKWNDVQQKRFDDLRIRDLSGALTAEEQAELAAGYAFLEQEENLYLEPAIAQMDVEQAAMRERLEIMQADNEELAAQQEQLVVDARRWLADYTRRHKRIQQSYARLTNERLVAA